MADSTNINDIPASDANKLDVRQSQQISSLSSFNMKMQRRTEKQIQSMDKRIESIMRYQAITKKRAEYASNAIDKTTAANKALASSTSKVLGSLNTSIKYLAEGTKKITVSTAVGTKQLLDSYGKAISQDISINKQNMVASALAQASPIFGYFASKFMETDVFQDTAFRIKTGLGDAVKSAFGNAIALSKSMARATGDRLSEFFTRTPKIEYSDSSKRYMGDVGIATKDTIERIKTKREEKQKQKERKEEIKREIKRLKTEGVIKQAQTGAYVKKGGLVNVHTGEVITPVEKIGQLNSVLRRVKESETGEQATKSWSTITRLLSENVLRMEEYVGENKKINKSIVETFVKGYKEARSPAGKSWEDRMLKATLEMKIAMTGMTSRLTVAWQRVLTEHPFFKNMVGSFEILRMGIVSPLKFLFGMRGGYRRYLPKGTNQFQNISSILNITFVQQMERLDKIVFYLKTLTTSIVGDDGKKLDKMFEEQRDPRDKEYSLFSSMKDLIAGQEKQKQKWSERLFDTVTAKLDLDKKVLQQSGMTTVTGMMNPAKIVSGAGMGKEFREKKKGEIKESYEGLKEKVKEKIPKLQAGGMVKKGGVVEAHAGEVIAPASKMATLFKSLKDATKNLVGATKNLNDTTKQQIEGEKERSLWEKAKSAGANKLDSITGWFKDKAFDKEFKKRGKKGRWLERKNKLKNWWQKQNKKTLALKTAIFYKTGGWFTGGGLFDEEGRIDPEKAKKTYVDPIKNIPSWLKKKGKQAGGYIGGKTAGVRDYLDTKTGYREKFGKAKEFTSGKYGEAKAKVKEEANKRGLLLDTTAKRERLAAKHAETMKSLQIDFSPEAQSKRLKNFEKELTIQYKKHKANTAEIDKRADKVREKIRERQAAKVFKNKTQEQITNEKKLNKKIDKMKTDSEKDREEKLQKVRDNGDKKRNRITEAWNRRTLRKQKKMQEAIEKAQGSTMVKHNKLLRYMFDSNYRFQRSQEKMKQKQTTQAENLEKKRKRAREKVDKLRLRLETQRERIKTKIKLQEEKLKDKIKTQQEKLQGRIDFLKEKQKLKQQLAAAKRQAKLDKPRLKKERMEMKLKMIKQREEMKKEAKEFKRQMKEDKAQLKKELKEARKEQWDMRKKLFKERVDYLVNAPKKFSEATKKFIQNGKEQLEVQKKQLTKLSKLEGAFQRVKDVIWKIGEAGKKAVGWIWKFVLIALSFGRNIIIAGFRNFVWPLITGAVSGLMSSVVIPGLTKAFEFFSKGFLSKVVGIFSLISGIKDMKRDYTKGTQLAERWGVDKHAAGFGAALGGTQKGILGAWEGTKKGFLVGMGAGAFAGPGAFIGGVIGAISGGILGAIGGENIAKALNYIIKPIKDFVKAIASPFIKAWEYIKEKVNNFKNAIVNTYESVKWEISTFFGWIGSTIGGIWQGIKDYIKEKIGSIPIIGPKILRLIESNKEERPKDIQTSAVKVISEAEANGVITKPWESYDEFIARQGGTTTGSYGNVIPHAQTGGFVTKSGLIKVHAGEIISPLSDEIKDRIQGVITNGKDIAKRDAQNETLKTKTLIQETAKSQKAAMDNFAKTSSLATSTVINNVTNMMSSSMQTIANNMGNKDRGHFDPLAQQILEGDIN